MKQGFRVWIAGEPVQEARLAKVVSSVPATPAAEPRIAAPKNAARSIEQQLADLTALSKACEKLAEKHGLRVVYDVYAKASRVIQDGGTLEQALAVLG